MRFDTKVSQVAPRWGHSAFRWATAREIRHTMSEALTPEQDTIETGDEEDRPDEEYGGPDPEEDEKGDGADEDQGT